MGGTQGLWSSGNGRHRRACMSKKTFLRRMSYLSDEELTQQLVMTLSKERQTIES